MRPTALPSTSIAVAATIVLGAAGCGEGAAGGGQAPGAAASSQAATTEERQGVRDAVREYLSGFTEKDASRVCSRLSSSAQRGFRGSCESSVAAGTDAMSDLAFYREALSSARVADVRFASASRASVSMSVEVAGETQPFRITAVKESGRWRLENPPAAEQVDPGRAKAAADRAFECPMEASEVATLLGDDDVERIETDDAGRCVFGVPDPWRRESGGTEEGRPYASFSAIGASDLAQTRDLYAKDPGEGGKVTPRDGWGPGGFVLTNTISTSRTASAYVVAGRWAMLAVIGLPSSGATEADATAAVERAVDEIFADAR